MGSGFKKPDDLKEFFESWFSNSENTTSGFQPVTTDLEELIHAAYQKVGLRWPLDCLNKSLGSLRKGDFGYIFARPETGKTTFLAAVVAHMLKQTDGNVCWFNNEEQDNKVIIRVYQAFFGVRLEQLMSNPKRYKEMFLEQTQDRFKFFGIDRCNKTDTEAILKEFDPVLTVYDQLDKWQGFSADREDLLLGSIYQWARELAKRHGAGIGVSQADGQAEGVKWLTMQHCANAKTAKQAEADWILGIGKTHEQGTEYVRYFSICKNKLFGDEDSLPALRHGRFETIIEPEIANYKDVIKYE